MIYKVSPKDETGRLRLIENIGRDSWRYGGTFEKGQVNHTLNGETRVIEVWFYDFNKILDEDVKQHMIRSRARMLNCTRDEAEQFLQTRPCAVPCDDVELEVLSEANPFQGEEMRCCMCGRKQTSDPKVESQWSYIEADGFGAYVCPACLQHSKQATRGHYATVYEKVIRRVIRLRERHMRGLNN